MTASSFGRNTEGESCSDKQNVAEKYNIFYTTVASKFIEKFSKSIGKFSKHFVERFYRKKDVKPNSFSVVSENRVLNYSNNVSVK